jgi:class 3 adenylate cyclase/tetratricopeptide (TPR) repeat protein
VSRRLVAVLFMDLVGWTSLGDQLDPEPLQLFLEQYYEISVAAVNRNGGIVEKFIGDAIMAVFGAERSLEDDALRALQTAVQARALVSGLAVSGASAMRPAVHCGIAAGEALVTQSAHAGVRIVGDVVNLAARLQSAAPSGEIYLNEVMARLVRAHADLASVAPVQLKGKPEPVPVWRAIEVTGPAARARSLSPLVDRSSERGQLLSAYRAAAGSGSGRLVAVQGPPGVGKSRLVREVVEQLAAESGANPLTAFASALAGTYPALAQLAAAFLADPEVAGHVAHARGGRLMRVLSRIGDPHEGYDDKPAPGAEDASWAMRELFAHAAARPAVVVWEDLDSADPTLLAIIADLTDCLRSVPALMICVARQLPGRFSFGAQTGDPACSLLEVGALSLPDTAGLVGQLAAAAMGSGEVTGQSADVLDGSSLEYGSDALRQVIEDCAGNPLFAELMVETLALGYAPGDVPPTITALVGAMLDRLPAPVETMFEAASVVGPAFTLERLAMLDAGDSPGAINELSRRQLIAPGEEPGAYRFAQRVTHEVTYRRVDKRQRVRLHRLLADHGVSPGQHLEAVVRLLGEVGADDPELPRLAARAARALLGEGTQALRRRDLPAAVGLLTRARDIAPDTAAGGDSDGAVAAIRLSDAHLLAGNLAAARQVLASAVEGAPRSRAGRACRAQRAILAVRAGDPAEEEAVQLAAELRLDRADHVSWCRLHQLRMLQQLGSGRFRAAEQAARRALDRAVSLSDEYEQDRLRAALCEVGQWSPTSVPDKLAFCTELVDRFVHDGCLLVPVLVVRARFAALLGDIGGATAGLAEAREIATDLRLALATVLVDQVCGVVASLGGRHEDAERYFRLAVAALEQAGQQPAALAVRGLAAREALNWRPAPEAVEEAGALVGLTDQMDLRGRVIALGVTARAAAVAGHLAGGFPAAAAAVVAEQATAARSLLDRTDDACLRGDVLADVAAAHALAGEPGRARVLARAAAARYGAIGASLPLRRVQQWM